MIASVAQPRRFARRALERLGLFGPVYRSIQRRVARGDPGEVPAGDDRPMPPPWLITLVNTNPSYAWFSEQGRSDAGVIQSLAERHGRPLPGAAVLDFGCGCGRVARWTAPLVHESGGRFTGADINPQLVGWCAANLPGAYKVTRFNPPLPFAEHAFDLLYSLSVLTHMKQATAAAWLEEIARVLKPDGLGIISFHDEDFTPADLKPRLAEAPWVLNTQVLEGSNYLGSFTTRSFFEALCSRRFEVLEIVPSQLEAGRQAFAVLRPKRGRAKP